MINYSVMNIFNHLPSAMVGGIGHFSQFPLLDLMLGLTLQNTQPRFGHVLNSNNIQRLVLSS